MSEEQELPEESANRTLEESASPKKSPTLGGPLPAIETLGTSPESVDENPNSKGNRFRPSQITHPNYASTRIRRFEPYQVSAVRANVALAGVTSVASVDGAIANPKALRVLGKMLGACLVHPDKAQLFRRGEPGVARLMKDLSPQEIVNASKVALELSVVFPS